MKVFVFLIIILKLTETTPLKAVFFEVQRVTNKTQENDPTTRIFGGHEANEEQFKFMIFVLMKYSDAYFSKCSSSLISSDWVLLAAHCLSVSSLKAKDIILVGGKANLEKYIEKRLQIDFDQPINEENFGVQERRAEKFFIHPSFDDDFLVHDVALIKTDKKFSDDLISIIPMSPEKITKKKSCMILGWGMTHNGNTNKLHYAENIQVSTTTLGCSYKNKGAFICLIPDGRGIRNGDSGSPLVCENQVWGVASHYLIDENTEKIFEEYFTEMHEDLAWVKSVYSKGNISTKINFETFIAGIFTLLWISIKNK